jgi:hypothetical protein
MRVAVVISDLMLFSRIEAATASAGARLLRVDSPMRLPAGDPFDLILVDWSARAAGWADALRARTGTRIILFGPHTDLEAHGAARAAELGPMGARSRLIGELASLLSVSGADAEGRPAALG